MTQRILDVGCGRAKSAGAIGIDVLPLPGVDIVHDLNVVPWPLHEDTFDSIIARHVIEHVDDVVGFMTEIHRVARSGAIIDIVTPHFTNRFSYTDPTHQRHLGLRSMDYFVEPAGRLSRSILQKIFETQYPVSDFGFYSAVRFQKVHTHLTMARPFRLLGIQWAANRWSDFYELYCAFVIPARDIVFRLKVLK